MFAVFIYPLSLYAVFGVIAGWLVPKYVVVSLKVSAYCPAPVSVILRELVLFASVFCISALDPFVGYAYQWFAACEPHSHPGVVIAAAVPVSKSPLTSFLVTFR